MSNDLTKREEQRPEAVAARPAQTPRVDIFENKDELLLVADMPGAQEDGIKIHLEKEHLTLSAKLPELEMGRALAAEFRRMDYRRSFVLPDTIDRDKISAEIKDGILRLRLPKSDAVKPRRIEVRSA